jgi:alkanesulfonate monooxygenase SsuD/methylene tetrahydromethanopterin reductase-like flavin-dependent oxidoreductase (luciferase family)
MKLGIVLSTRDGDAIAGDTFVQSMQHGEEVGFDWLWFFDTIGRGYLNPDPLGAACAAGAVTKRIEIGTCIVQTPMRNPIEMAHCVLTTHTFCQGRFRLGVGACSTEADFNSLGLDFSQRFSNFASGLETMQALWRGETVNGMDLTPWPVALGGPPVQIGSWAGGRWIQIAAERYDGWIGSAVYTTLGALKIGAARYKSHGGKRAIATNIQVDLTQSSSGRLSDDDKFDLRCQPEEAKARLRMLAECGFDDAIFVIQDHSAANLAALRELA